MIAKASTTCTYSLDPITLSPGTHPSLLVTGILLALVPSPHLDFSKQEPVDTYNHYPVSIPRQPGTHECTPGSSRNRHTLLLQIVKEQPMHQPKLATSSPVKNQSQTNPLWTRLAMCFIPSDPQHPLQTALVEVNGIEPMTSCLQSTRSPN